MRILDKKVLTKFDNKLDKSLNRNTISNSLKANGIYKTALDSGKKALHDNNFLKVINRKYHFNSDQGNDILNYLLEEIEFELSEKSKTSIKLSKAYIMFWERLERSNFILETLLLGGLDNSQRELNRILDRWMLEKGDWDSYLFLIQKYGLKTKEQVEETYISKNPNQLDNLIKVKLQQCSAILSRMKSSNFKSDEILNKKEKAMSDIFNMLVYSLGNPNLEYESLSISELKLNDEYLNVVNLPCVNLPFNNSYFSSTTKICLEQTASTFINLSFESIKEIMILQISSGNTVIIGNDEIISGVSNYYFEEMYDLNETMATCLDIDKGKRINFGISKINTISNIIGYGESPSNSIWKLINNGNEVIVDDNWLKENTYKFILNKDLINKVCSNIKYDNPTEIASDNPIGVLLQ
ncbi:C1 family peptidase [Candidatus Kapabacteria bacterium]|nr:C1 family peptidase [Candidatus Kapabacteria bacterium]